MSYAMTHLNGPLVQSFYLSAKESDITLVVDGHRIAAHKFVLAAKSQVFKTMFFGDFKEAMAREVLIGDMSVEALKLLLKYCYYEDLTAEDWPSTDDSLIVDVFKAAHIYHMRPLCVICQLKLIGRMSVSNVADVLKLGFIYRSKLIRVMVRKFSKKLKEELIGSKELLQSDDKQVIKFLMRSMRFEQQLASIKALVAIIQKNNWNIVDFIGCLQLENITAEDLNYLRDNHSHSFNEIVMKKIEVMTAEMADLKSRVSDLERQISEANKSNAPKVISDTDSVISLNSWA